MRPYLITSFVILLLACIAPSVLAQGNTGFVYNPMVSLPRLDPNSQSTEEYAQALFFLSISLGAIAAFIKILFAGVKWMVSGSFSDKETAKRDIRGALVGLLIILSSVIILNTINPNLTRLDILRNAPSLGSVTPDPSGGTQATPSVDTSSPRTFTQGQQADKKAYEESCKASGGKYLSKIAVKQAY